MKSTVRAAVVLLTLGAVRAAASGYSILSRGLRAASTGGDDPCETAP